MKKEHVEELVTKYPELYKRTHPRNPFAMFSFECGDGWYNIINHLSWIITQHVKGRRAGKARALRDRRNGKELTEWQLKIIDEPAWRCRVAQVKEKFGDLRFYVDGGDDFIYGAIQMAESISSITCEECGKPGKIEGTGWVSCRCIDCRKAKEYGNEKL